MARLPHYPPRQKRPRFAFRVRLQESSMGLLEKGPLGRLRAIVVFACLGLTAASGLTANAAERNPRGAQQAAPAAARPVGTVKVIAGKTIVLTTDAGAEVAIEVQD